MTTKADQQAADRVLNAAIIRAVDLIRSHYATGYPRPAEIIDTLTTAGRAAGLLLDRAS